VSVAVSIHLPDQLAYQLGKMADTTDDSMSIVVQKALESYFEELEDLQVALNRLNDPTDTVISMEEMRSEIGL